MVGSLILWCARKIQAIKGEVIAAQEQFDIHKANKWNTSDGSLLRSSRQQLHAQIAEALETRSPKLMDSQPELFAQHYDEAGLVEKAAVLWGKAGLRSMERSALAEAIEQLTRALERIATLPGTPALRGEEIRFQVALLYSLRQVKGHGPETKTVAERALLLIEQAEALGEPPKDPLLLFRALYGLWRANIAAFNGDLAREELGLFADAAEAFESCLDRGQADCRSGVARNRTRAAEGR